MVENADEVLAAHLAVDAESPPAVGDRPQNSAMILALLVWGTF